MIRVQEHKHETENKAIERMPAPAKVYIPLNQHLGKLCSAEVKAGDVVSLGQRVAAVQSNVSAPIHSSVSGKVAGIFDWPHPVLNSCKAIVIENDGVDRSPGHQVNKIIKSPAIKKRQEALLTDRVADFRGRMAERICPNNQKFPLD